MTLNIFLDQHLENMMLLIFEGMKHCPIIGSASVYLLLFTD